MTINERQIFKSQPEGEMGENSGKEAENIKQAYKMAVAGQKKEKKSLGGILSLVGMLIIFILINFLFPPQAEKVYDISLSYLQEMALIIPPVFILMGLFEVWVPKAFIQKYLGEGAGLKGIALSFVFGTIPTGPVYIAFPIAAALLRKGARLMNIVIFLGIWAAAKLPQLMVEIKFLGPAFTFIRLALTVGSVIAMGFLVEYFLPEKEVRGQLSEEKPL